MKSPTRGQQLGDAIRRARQARGLSIRRLAEMAGVTHSFIAKLEAGRFQTVSPDNLTALAHALSVAPEDLFALSGYAVPERLPTFGPYLRARYGELPESAIDQLNQYFELLRDKYGERETTDDDSDDAASARGGRR